MSRNLMTLKTVEETYRFLSDLAKASHISIGDLVTLFTIKYTEENKCFCIGKNLFVDDALKTRLIYAEMMLHAKQTNCVKNCLRYVITEYRRYKALRMPFPFDVVKTSLRFAKDYIECVSNINLKDRLIQEYKFAEEKFKSLDILDIYVKSVSKTDWEKLRDKAEADFKNDEGKDEFRIKKYTFIKKDADVNDDRLNGAYHL